MAFVIYGIADGDPVVCAEDLLDIAGITLCAVAYKDFIRADAGAPAPVIALGNGISQEFVAQVRGIAMEGLCMAHFLHGFVHGLYDGRSQGLGDISDPKADNALLGVLRRICGDLFANVRKKIAARQL